MTRSRRQQLEDAAAHTETAHDPHLRPSTGVLVDKLRTMKVLKEHPETVAYVIHDLAHEFFYREAKRPDTLWKTLNRLHYLFTMMVNGGSPSASDYDVSTFLGIEPQKDSLELDAANKGAIQVIIAAHRSQEYVHGQFKCYCGRFYRDAEAWAVHVRIRIWRYFKNEFKPDGQEATEAERPAPST